MQTSIEFGKKVVFLQSNQLRMNNQITPAVKNLLIVNFILWLATMVCDRFAPSIDLTAWLGLHYWSADNFHFWQPITYMFMHGGFDHIFFNMFALYMFGSTLEYAWGSKRFLIFYFVAGLGAALVQELVWTIEYQPMLSAVAKAAEQGSAAGILNYEETLRHFLHFNYPLESAGQSELIRINELISTSLPSALTTIGASGCIFGLLFAYGWLFPDAKVFFIFVPIPIPSRIFVAIYAFIELFLGVANFSFDNVAHFAHLGGMLFGWLLLLYWRRKRKI